MLVQELSKSWSLGGGISWCIFLILEEQSYSRRPNTEAEEVKEELL